MGFPFLILYTILTYLRPWEFIVELAPLRMAFWAGNAALAVSFLAFIASGRYTLIGSPTLHFLICFFTVLVLSPVTATRWFGGVAPAFTVSMTNVVSCTLIVLTVRSIPKMRVLAATICLLSLVLVAQGSLAYYGLFATDKLVFMQRTEEDVLTGERGEFGRVRGLGQFNDSNDLAQALVAAAPLLWPVWRDGRRLRNFVLVVAPSLFLVYGVYLTRSRGAILSILVLIVMRTRERLTRFRTAGPVVAAVCVGVLMLAAGFTGGRDISSSDSSSEGRLAAWYDGLQMLRGSPLFGVGFGRFIDHHVRVAHNSFVHCFAELGLVGYFFWIGLLLSAHTDLWAMRTPATDDEDETALSSWATAVRFSLYAFLSGAFFLSRTYSITLYMIIGLATALGDIGRSSGQLDPPEWRKLLTHTILFITVSIAGIYLLVRIAH